MCVKECITATIGCFGSQRQLLHVCRFRSPQLKKRGKFKICHDYCQYYCMRQWRMHRDTTSKLCLTFDRERRHSGFRFRSNDQKQTWTHSWKRWKSFQLMKFVDFELCLFVLPDHTQAPKLSDKFSLLFIYFTKNFKWTSKYNYVSTAIIRSISIFIIQIGFSL